MQGKGSVSNISHLHAKSHPSHEKRSSSKIQNRECISVGRGWGGGDRGIPWKNTLLKNPEQGMHLGWKGMERRRWGIHARMRGERWRGRRILRRWRRKTGRGRPIRSTFEGHQLAIGAGVYLCGHFCRLFFHIQAQTVPIMHRKTAKSKNCITSSDQRIE